jgi:hypothetical protein
MTVQHKNEGIGCQQARKHRTTTGEATCERQDIECKTLFMFVLEQDAQLMQ